MNEYWFEIALAVIGVIATVVGGSLYSKSKKNEQSNIKISGKNNKFVGGDDNSKNKK